MWMGCEVDLFALKPNCVTLSLWSMAFFEPGLQDSGKDLVGCAEETDGPVHLWVCVAALSFIDFYHCGL